MADHQDERDVFAQRFGENLASARQAVGLSQEELGLRAGLHRTEIGKLENAERIPRIDSIVKLTSVLEVSVDQLVGGLTWEVPGRPEERGRFVPSSPGEGGPATAPMPGPLDPVAAERIAEHFQAFADPTRLLILDHLRHHGETAVGEIAVQVGSSQQNTSKHLAVLRVQRIVARRKQGTSTLYQVANASVNRICDQAREA